MAQSAAGGLCPCSVRRATRGGRSCRRFMAQSADGGDAVATTCRRRHSSGEQLVENATYGGFAGFDACAETDLDAGA